MRLIAIAILGMSVAAFAQLGGRGGRGGRVGGGRFPDDGGQTGGRCLVPGSGGAEDDSPKISNLARDGFVYARLRYHVQLSRNPSP